MKKHTHGGARPGAGAKRKTPTKIVGVRVPAHLYDAIKPKLKALAQTLINTSETPSTKY